MKWIILQIAFLLITGCSTVDRVVYYSPESNHGKISGPERPESGWLNFGGAPDTYSGREIRIKTDHDTQPYLWGPWFVSVVPVFPVTWTVKAFAEDSLTIILESDAIDFQEKLNKKENYNISYVEPPNKIVSVQSNGITYGSIGNKSYLTAIFPLGRNQLDSFSLIINSREEIGSDIDVKFIKKSRWRWKQWPIN